MNSIYNYRLEEIKEILKNNGEKEFKATQIYEWLYKKRIKNFNEMTNIKKETIKYLEENFQIEPLKPGSSISNQKTCPAEDVPALLSTGYQ